MKKIVFIILITVLSYTQSSAQLMSLGFVKNCMSYNRTALSNEMFRKHFFMVENSIATAQNNLLVGAMSYANEKNPANGQIKVLSLIKEKQQICEIYFVNGPKNDYSTNYAEVYNQMVSFFNNQISFKSTKYNVDVVKFTKADIYYYVYKLKEIPVIVVANYKLDDIYFK
jgi:hypothetical protein